MKTKHFLTALAIPALLAACSAEDDLTLNNAQNLAGRKLINADLTFDFSSDAATRLAIGETAITLDENDKVAAALIDKVGEGTVNGYEITTGISTNHPFSLNGTGWSTPTQLVEGNYLFYYQYNEKLGGNRSVAVPYKINKVQNAFSEKEPKTFVGSQAVKDNAVGIGYAFLGAEKGVTPNNVKVNMYNLFAFLKFNIKTDKTGLKVQQILVKRGDSAKFALEGTISNSKVAARGSQTANNEGQSEENPKNAGVLTAANGTDKVYTANYSTGTPNANDDYVILSLPDLAATATAQSAYMVIPAANYTSSADDNDDSRISSEFIVDVYTNQGVYTRTVELSKTGDGGNTNLATMALGTVQPITLNITGTLKAAEKYFVGNAEQWSKVLNSLPAVAANASVAAKTLNIELLNEVELTADDIALIQSTDAKDYTINIAGGKLTLTESCELSDMTVNNVSIKAGATVELNKNLTVTTLGNAGTININAVTGTENKVASIATLNNSGVANIEANAEITTVENGSDDAKADNSAVELNVNKNLTVTTFTNNAGETADKNATVTVGQNAVLTTNTGTNKGAVENEGQIIANGIFTNTGAKAVINNQATGILSNVNGSDKAVKNLEGANINAMNGSTTIVADNTASTITYQDGANVSVTGSEAAKGKIAYVIASTYLVPAVGVEYNTIVVDGLNIKLNTSKTNTAAGDLLGNANITNVVLKNGAIVDFSLQSDAVTLIEVEGINNKIITAAGGISTATLKVLENGYILIPLNSKVTSTGSAEGVGLQNNGTINVGGTLVYKTANAVKGQLLGTGTITGQD